MASTTGTVSCIATFDDGGYVQIVDTTGTKEAFTIWAASPETTASERILYSMWVSLFRQSLVSGVPVTIFSTSASSTLISTVVFGTYQ